jgi:hypothetical protein
MISIRGVGSPPKASVANRSLPGEEARNPETLFGTLLSDINFPYPF